MTREFLVAGITTACAVAVLRTASRVNEYRLSQYPCAIASDGFQ